MGQQDNVCMERQMMMRNGTAALVTAIDRAT